MTSGALTRVPGFRASGIAAGIKASGNLDLALIVSDHPCTAAAAFTTNAFQAAPVLFDRALLERKQNRGLQAILTNAGNANACTGSQGDADAARMAAFTAEALSLPPDSVFVMSTGIIGQPLPMDKLESGIKTAAAALGTSPNHGTQAAQAIMTTDLVSKEAYRQIEIDGQAIHLGGIAKGSGMIHPNMATMLAAIVTDANIAATDLQVCLTRAIATTFNRVSVDGDTSTNDTVVLLANGAAGETSLRETGLATFTAALTDLCADLAKQIARDGEGATKLIEVRISGAPSDEEAAQAAATVAISPLVKTAIFGHDPNWGRILMAIGRSSATVSPGQTSLWMEAGDFRVQLVAAGQPRPFDAAALSAAMQAATDIILEAEIGPGPGTATYWTCDFSYKYVEINAEYHT